LYACSEDSNKAILNGSKYLNSSLMLFYLSSSGAQDIKIQKSKINVPHVKEKVAV
jgi:hypothetical protein